MHTGNEAPFVHDVHVHAYEAISILMIDCFLKHKVEIHESSLKEWQCH